MSGIAVHHTDTDEARWDGPGNEARLRSGESQAYYRRAYAWQDPDGDPTTKAAYKFIHHFVSGDGEPGAASTRGCSAGIAVLNGGRGGADIPDRDRRPVWNHLAAHLKDAGMEPPELRVDGGEIERRSFAGEIRTIKRDDKTKIVGYAAIFGQESEDLGGWREVIEPGAFADGLRGDVRALFNHDPNIILGRTPHTLTLDEDAVGLRYEIDPPDTQGARDLLVSLERGDVNQSSFGFRVIEESWEPQTEERKYPLRRVRKVKLFDISPVTFPAYVMTSAEARSMASELSRRATALDIAVEAEAAGRLDTLKRKVKLLEV